MTCDQPRSASGPSATSATSSAAGGRSTRADEITEIPSPDYAGPVGPRTVSRASQREPRDERRLLLVSLARSSTVSSHEIRLESTALHEPDRRRAAYPGALHH